MPINKVQPFEFDTINNAPWTGRSSIGELLYSILNLTEGQTASPIGSGAEMSLPMMSTPLLMGMSKRYTPGMKYRREFYRIIACVEAMVKFDEEKNNESGIILYFS